VRTDQSVDIETLMCVCVCVCERNRECVYCVTFPCFRPYGRIKQDVCHISMIHYISPVELAVVLLNERESE